MTSPDPSAKRPDLTAYWLFATLVALFIAIRLPFAWTGNEENYFLLAHKLVAPQAYDPLFAVFDNSRGKWLALSLLGLLVQAIGFEAAHTLFGLICIAALASGVAAVAQMLRLGLLPALSMVLLFLVLGQSIVGGEWFIVGFETKTLAYAAGLWALAMAGAGRERLAGLLVAAASYCHFLVGGYWLIVVGLFFGWGQCERRQLQSFASIAVLLMIPLLIGLGMDVADGRNAVRPAGSSSADIIYSVIRAPHHMAPFADTGGWAGKALAGAVAGLLLSAAAWVAAERARGALRQLCRTVSVVALLLPAAVVLSWIDRDTAYLGKFYLFRPASPLLLLALLGGAAVAARQTAGLRHHAHSWLAVAAALSLLLVAKRGEAEWPLETPDMTPLVAAVQANTAPRSVVLIDPRLDQYLAEHLPRQLGRPTVVSWKFVPLLPAELYRWKRLIEWREALFERGCPSPNGRIAALIVAPSNVEAKARCGRLVYRDADSAVIMVR